ncbi:MAG: ethanolamine ammonia-lyase reactivating factor EutA [Oscillospiraceae bacterium]|nr:ethanolamine ammonia-lyase reactivating factor EutA [Oscillospiraceae bacterium]
MIGVAERIISVGIDIGTTTTQLIFSRFVIENTAGSTSVPRISIVDKQIVYESAIHITPLLSQSRIDEAAVREIVLREYKLAGFEPAAVTTGAVIITGETARKENAGTVLSAMSGLAGDFVVATAGPALEGIIAGKGSGAARISLERHETTANLDVGGGTTNIAVFSEGEVLATACFDIGGRLIKFRDGSLIVDYIAPKIRKYCRETGIHIEAGQISSKQDVMKACSWMANVLLASVGFAKSDDLEFLATDHVLKCPPPRFMTFSGGVADYIYNAPDRDFPNDDIGAVLGRQIRSAFSGVWDRILSPTHTIRATVIGAGMYSTELSGSTITYNEVDFPVKNIPIVRLSPEQESLPPERFAEVVKERLAWYKEEDRQTMAALSISGQHNISFDNLQQYAVKLAAGLAPLSNAGLPQIIIVEHDMAKALGQTLLNILNNRQLICIDGVSTSQGDYIDIGAPLMGGRVLPIVIKTLVLS